MNNSNTTQRTEKAGACFIRIHTEKAAACFIRNTQDTDNSMQRPTVSLTMENIEAALK